MQSSVTGQGMPQVSAGVGTIPTGVSQVIDTQLSSWVENKIGTCGEIVALDVRWI